MARPWRSAAETLFPERRILSYLAFVVSLFLFPVPLYYFILFMLLCVFLARLPFRTLKSGWVPITMFLCFTFVSNVLYHPGRVMYAAGSLLITQEGLQLASIRTARVLLMIGGVKCLMAGTSTDAMIAAMSRLLHPFDKVGVPVKDFFSTMGLTVTCVPLLKDAITGQYRERLQQEDAVNILDKAKLIASFLLPLFVESIRTPERFFKNNGAHEEKH